MQIVIEILGGKTITLEVESSNTIDDVMAQIQDKEGIPPFEQRLLYNSKRLMGCHTLADYDIQNDCKLYLMFRLGGSPCLACQAAAQSFAKA